MDKHEKMRQASYLLLLQLESRQVVRELLAEIAALKANVRGLIVHLNEMSDALQDAEGECDILRAAQRREGEDHARERS